MRSALARRSKHVFYYSGDYGHRRCIVFDLYSPVYKETGSCYSMTDLHPSPSLIPEKYGLKSDFTTKSGIELHLVY